MGEFLVTTEETITLKSAINDVDIKKNFPDITDQGIENLINILTKNNYESLNNSNKGGDLERDMYGEPGDGVIELQKQSEQHHAELQKQSEQHHAEEEKKLNLLKININNSANSANIDSETKILTDFQSVFNYLIKKLVSENNQNNQNYENNLFPLHINNMFARAQIKQYSTKTSAIDKVLKEINKQLPIYNKIIETNLLVNKGGRRRSKKNTKRKYKSKSHKRSIRKYKRKRTRKH
jgi:hypothetical protein